MNQNLTTGNGCDYCSHHPCPDPANHALWSRSSESTWHRRAAEDPKFAHRLITGEVAHKSDYDWHKRVAS